MKRRSTADVEAYRERIDSLLREAQYAVMTEGERGAKLGRAGIELSTSGPFSDEPYALGVVRGLRAVCEALVPIGKHAEAARTAHELMRWCKRYPDLESFEMYGLTVLGHAMIHTGDAESSLKILAEALAIAEREEDIRQQAACMEIMGIAYSASGQSERELPLFRKALILRRRAGDPIGVAYALNNVAMAEIDRGSPEIGVEYAQTCAEVIREHGIPVLFSAVMDTLAQAHAKLGNTQHAIEFFEQARASSREHHVPIGEGEALLNLGRLLSSEEATRQEGLARLRQARDILEQCEATALLSACHKELARVFESEGDLAAAMEHLKKHHVLELRLSGEQADERVETIRAVHEKSANSA